MLGRDLFSLPGGISGSSAVMLVPPHRAAQQGKNFLEQEDCMGEAEGFRHDLSKCRCLLYQALCCKVLISTDEEQCLQHPPNISPPTLGGPGAVQRTPPCVGWCHWDGTSQWRCCQAHVGWNLPEPQDLCYSPSGNTGVRNSAGSGPSISLGLPFLLCKPLSF